MKIGSANWLFMAEAEGLDTLVDTREAKLNAIIREFNALPAFAQTQKQLYILAEDRNISLTSSDIAYIQRHL